MKTLVAIAPCGCIVAAFFQPSQEDKGDMADLVLRGCSLERRESVLIGGCSHDPKWPGLAPEDPQGRLEMAG